MISDDSVKMQVSASRRSVRDPSGRGRKCLCGAPTVNLLCEPCWLAGKPIPARAPRRSYVMGGIRYERVGAA